MSGTYDQFLEAMRYQESSDHYDMHTTSYLGAYQFGEQALIQLGYVSPDSDPTNNDFSGGWTGKNGINSISDFLGNPSAQDIVAGEWWADIWTRIRRNNVEFYDGQTINGVKLTISGMIAGAHLVGVSKLVAFINSGGTAISADANGTTIVDYINKFSGYSMSSSFSNNLDQDNVLKGGSGNDEFQGQNGRDVFTSSGGSDVYWGGNKNALPVASDGYDTVKYSSASSAIGINVDFSQSSPQVEVANGQGGVDILHSIEEIDGTSFKDKLSIKGKIPVGFSLTIDGRGGQGDSIDLGKSLNTAGYNLKIDKSSGLGVVTNISGGGGQIFLQGFKTDITGSDGDDRIDDESPDEHEIDGGAGNDVITVGGVNAVVDGGSGNDVIHLKSASATINFGVGGGSDVVEFDAGDGDYTLALQNLNPGDVEFIAGGRDVYAAGVFNQNNSPEGFWYQFITVKVRSTGDQITFLENGKNIGPDGNGSAIAYNKGLGNDPQFDPGATTVNQGKLDSITFADGTVMNQGDIWNALGDGTIDYWAYPSDYTLPVEGFPPRFGTIAHDANSYLDYVNRTYLQADPVAGPPPPPKQALTGTSGDDSMAPGYGNDTVTGGAGNDTIQESAGNDTYVWNAGDDNDTVTGSSANDGVNTLQLGAGIAPADLQFAVANDGAGLTLSFAGQQGSVTLGDELVGDGFGVDQIQFADSTVMTRAQLLSAASSVIAAALIEIDGTSDDDFLSVPQGNFIVHAGSGNDYILESNSGSGTLEFASTDGHDQVADNGSGYSRNDTLELTDVTSDGVTLTRSGDALLVTVESTGASVNIRAQFESDGDNVHGIGAIKFADGEIWTRADIRNIVLGLTDDTPPVAEAGVTTAVEDAAIVRGTLIATDPDAGDSPTFSLDGGVDGLVLAADGSWSFDPSAGSYTHLAGGEQLTVVANYHVTDAVGATSASTLTINLTGTDDIPVVVEGLANQRLTEGAAFTYDVSSHFTDPDGDAVVLTAALADGSALPDWLTFQNGQFSGTAPNEAVPPVNVVVKASDGTFYTSSSFLLDVGNQAPVVQAPLQDVTGDANSPLDIAIPTGTFFDLDGDALTLTVTLADGTALPDWLSFSNGHLVGTPSSTEMGESYDIKVSASDGQASASTTFSLSILNYELGTSGDDSYDLTTGFALRGGLGDDYYSVTGDGSGTFYFSKGDGHDVLEQPDFGVRSDTLVFTDVDSTDVTITRNGDAAEILVNSTGDTFTADWQFFGDEPGGVSQGLGQIQFADGVTWDRADIERLTGGGGGGGGGPEVDNGIADSIAYRGQAVDLAIPSDAFSDTDGTMTYSATLADGSALPSWLSLDGDHLVGTVPDTALGILDVEITATDGNASASTVFKLTTTVETGAPITSDQWQLVTDGNDRILDNGPNTGMSGFGGDDVITLDAWNVSADGGDGNDVFEMFGNDDNVTGGNGADTFLFDSGALVRSAPNPDAWATINDFVPGEDRIGILNGTGDVANFADLQQYMSQSGSDVLIQFQGLPTITLSNVSLTDLSATDFLFTQWASTGTSDTPPPVGVVPYPTTTNTVDLYNGTGDFTDGNDRVLGNGAGNIDFHTQAGDDYITTDGWNVTAYGDQGNDVFEINGTVNTIIGGPGYDYYVFDSTEITSFSQGDTWATIADYADGTDKIVFRNGTGGMTDFDDLGQYMAQDGSDVTIALPDLPTIRLTNVSLSELDASDFIFDDESGSPQANAAAMVSSTSSDDSSHGLTSHLSGGPAQVLLSRTGRAPLSNAADPTSIQKAAAMLTEASARFGVASSASEWHDSASDAAWQHRQHTLARPMASLA